MKKTIGIFSIFLALMIIPGAFALTEITACGTYDVATDTDWFINGGTTIGTTGGPCLTFTGYGTGSSPLSLTCNGGGIGGDYNFAAISLESPNGDHQFTISECIIQNKEIGIDANPPFDATVNSNIVSNTFLGVGVPIRAKFWDAPGGMSFVEGNYFGQQNGYSFYFIETNNGGEIRQLTIRNNKIDAEISKLIFENSGEPTAIVGGGIYWNWFGPNTDLFQGLGVPSTPAMEAVTEGPLYVGNTLTGDYVLYDFPSYPVVAGNYWGANTGCSDSDGNYICDSSFADLSLGTSDTAPLIESPPISYSVCPEVIGSEANGKTILLTADVDAGPQECMIMFGADATIDCQGHTITGLNGFQINGGSNTIQNCNFETVGYGIDTLATEVFVINNNFTGSFNAYALGLQETISGTVRSNIINHTGNIGIYTSDIDGISFYDNILVATTPFSINGGVGEGVTFEGLDITTNIMGVTVPFTFGGFTGNYWGTPTGTGYSDTCTQHPTTPGYCENAYEVLPTFFDNAVLTTPVYCTPDWSCTGYEECVSPATTAACNNVTDNNACGETYSGNYSEFATTTCTYPSSSGGSGTSYAVDASGNVVGVYQGTTLVQSTQTEQKGTFLSLTGGEPFDLKTWWNNLVTTIKGWFTQ
jgi:hypothetical protein